MFDSSSRGFAPRAVKSAPSSPCSWPRVMPPRARATLASRVSRIPQLTLVRRRVARQQPSLARPTLQDALATFLADSVSVASHFHLLRTSSSFSCSGLLSSVSGTSCSLKMNVAMGEGGPNQFRTARSNECSPHPGVMKLPMW